MGRTRALSLNILQPGSVYSYHAVAAQRKEIQKQDQVENPAGAVGAMYVEPREAAEAEGSMRAEDPQRMLLFDAVKRWSEDHGRLPRKKKSHSPSLVL